MKSTVGFIGGGGLPGGEFSGGNSSTFTDDDS